MVIGASALRAVVEKYSFGLGVGEVRRVEVFADADEVRASLAVRPHSWVASRAVLN
jgi:hypothetical protein